MIYRIQKYRKTFVVYIFTLINNVHKINRRKHISDECKQRLFRVKIKVPSVKYNYEYTFDAHLSLSLDGLPIFLPFESVPLHARNVVEQS